MISNIKELSQRVGMSASKLSTITCRAEFSNLVDKSKIYDIDKVESMIRADYSKKINTYTKKEIGNKTKLLIKKLYCKEKIQMKEIAKHLNVAPSTISAWYNMISFPTNQNFKKLKELIENVYKNKHISQRYAQR